MRPAIVRCRWILATLAGLAACAEDPVAPAPAVHRVTLSEPSLLEVGDERQLIASALDRDDDPVDGETFTWTSSDPAIATVSGTGVVRGVSAGGPVRISVSAAGRQAAVHLTVVQGPVLMLSATDLAFDNLGQHTRTVQVSNAGTGFIAGLAIAMPGDATAAGWLTSMSLSTTTAPAVLTVVTDALALAPGDYQTRVPLYGLRNGRADSAAIQLRLAVRGVALQTMRAGYNQSCGQGESGVLCWGTTAPALFGPGEGTSRNRPFQVASAPPFVQVVAGEFHRCGRTATGEVWCWGGNQYGQVGNGTMTDVPLPVRVGGTALYRDLTAGAGYTCAVRDDNAGFCWGSQTGDGTLERRATPTPIAGGLTFAEVEGSSNHACGRTTAGEVWCWGLNSSGELGDGTQVNSFTPVRAIPPVAFKEMVVGVSHTCAIGTNDITYCWGLNSSGQLGLGTTTNHTTATPLTGAPTFARLASGRLHTCGITAAGAAWCWGSNASRQLGVGSTTSTVPTPAPVTGEHVFLELSGGTAHTCGRTAAATWCWGSNTSGQLGNGTVIARALPTLVIPPLPATASAAALRATILPGVVTPPPPDSLPVRALSAMRQR